MINISKVDLFSIECNTRRYSFPLYKYVITQCSLGTNYMWPFNKSKPGCSFWWNGYFLSISILQ